jgi:primosomal protein N' (replication factor Y)
VTASPGSRRRRAAERVPAPALPVARVAVDVSLAHLDRPFDYLVDERVDDQVVPGARVRVRFSGQLVDGFVLERVEASEHVGRLSYVERAVSPEPVLTPEVASLARLVADHWGGTLADVVRLAVPPRHAAVEAKPNSGPPSAVAAPAPGGWLRYPAGAALVDELSAGAPVHAVWAALPGPQWPQEVATLVTATLSAGRGAVVVVPDARDVERVDAALTAALGEGRHVALTAGIGPAERYRRFLAVSRGAVRAVVGTRAAVWAPVHELGLVLVWDDGDDLHAEPRAPYPHARDVAVLRAHHAGAAAVIGGFAVTAEGAALVRRGWARGVTADRETVREIAPRVVASGDDAELARDPLGRAARLPSVGWDTLREGLQAGGPVLVQVPRRGYQPALACAACRASARCARCAGPLGRRAEGELPACRWCAAPAAAWRCPSCGGERLRVVVVGARRTAEELGRAFPGVPVRTSGGDAVLARVAARPAVVVATPGAEPVADGGYAAALLLDGWALLSRADLRAAEEALRRWLGAAALVRPAGEGGRVVVVADAGVAAVQALVRWQPAWHAERELDDRAALGFPPATRMASVSGHPAAVADLLAAAVLPEGTDLLGPVPLPPADGEPVERVLLRVARAEGGALAAALKAGQGVRSARKAPDPLRVQLDPVELG